MRERPPPAPPEPPSPPASPARPPSRLAVVGFTHAAVHPPADPFADAARSARPRRDVAGASVDFDEVHRRAHEAGGTAGRRRARRGRHAGLRQRAASRPVIRRARRCGVSRFVAGGAGQRNAVGVMLVDAPVRDRDLRAAIARIAREHAASRRPRVPGPSSITRRWTRLRRVARRQRLVGVRGLERAGPAVAARDRRCDARRGAAAVAARRQRARRRDGRVVRRTPVARRRGGADHVAPAAGIAEVIADALGGVAD